MDPFLSDVCCNSQPRFDETAKFFHKLREADSPDHSSFPVSKYECLCPRVSCVKAGGFPVHKFLH